MDVQESTFDCRQLSPFHSENLPNKSSLAIKPQQ